MSDLKCGICLVYHSLTEGDYFVNTPCGHIYHYECIRSLSPKGRKSLGCDYFLLLFNLREYKCPECQKKVNLKRLVKLQGLSPIEFTMMRIDTFKMIVIGEHGCGKTSIMRTFAQGEFPTEVESTIGCDVYFKTIDISGKIIKLSLWDTAGHERFAQMMPNFFRNVNGAMIVYDVTNPRSLESLDKWLGLIYDYSPSDTSVLLLGNKTDLRSKRQISTQKGKSIADDLGIDFLETSALQSQNLEAAFRTLAAQILEKSWKSSTSTSDVNGHLAIDDVRRQMHTFDIMNPKPEPKEKKFTC